MNDLNITKLNALEISLTKKVLYTTGIISIIISIFGLIFAIISGGDIFYIIQLASGLSSILFILSIFGIIMSILAFLNARTELNVGAFLFLVMILVILDTINLTLIFAQSII
jgi:hypothetical protein